MWYNLFSKWFLLLWLLPSECLPSGSNSRHAMTCVAQPAYGCVHFVCITEEGICSGVVLAPSLKHIQLVIWNVKSGAVSCLWQIIFKFQHAHPVCLVYILWFLFRCFCPVMSGRGHDQSTWWSGSCAPAVALKSLKPTWPEDMLLIHLVCKFEAGRKAPKLSY